MYVLQESAKMSNFRHKNWRNTRVTLSIHSPFVGQKPSGVILSVVSSILTMVSRRCKVHNSKNLFAVALRSNVDIQISDRQNVDKIIETVDPAPESIR
jgi:hypothetical protein